MSRKSIARFLVIALLLSLLAGCSPSGTTTGTGTTSGSTTTASTSGDGGKQLSGVVRVAYAGAKADDGINELTGEPQRGFNTAIKELFNTKYPDVKVEVTAIPWTDYSTKLQSLLMSKSVDVLGSGGDERILYNQGFLRELDDLIAADTEFKPEELYAGAAWDNCIFNTSVDGKKFGLPGTLGYRLIVYDKQLFDDWGVEYLSDHPTPEEVLEKAALMTGKNPKTGEQNYGLWFDGNDAANSLYTTLGIYYGAPGFSGNIADGIKSLTMEFNTPAAAKVFEFFEKAVKFCNPGIVSSQGAENFGLEANNTAIFLERNPKVIIANYQAGGKSDTSMIDRFVPTLNFGPNGEGWVAADNIVIAKDAQNLDASWEVAKFLASHDFYEYLYKDLNWVPPLTPDKADFLDENDIYIKKALEIAQHSSVNAHDYLPELNSLEITPFVAGYIAQCVNGQNPAPQAAADDLQQRAAKWQTSLK